MSQAYKIHPKIIEKIKIIILSDGGKELFDKNNPEHEKNEEKAKNGMINGVNGERFLSKNENTENEYNGIHLGFRSFKNIDSRYVSDNSDIQSNVDFGHFEMILAHELFHELRRLSRYQDSFDYDDSFDEEKKFDWMNSGSNDNNKSLEFTGILNSENYNNIVDDEGNIKDRYKDFVKFKNIKNKEGEDVKCQINDGDLLRPEKDIIYPERFISNYSREQVKKNGEEDFCDSMVVYAFDPEFLKEFDEKRGTKKFVWLEKRWGLYSKEESESPEIKIDIYKKDSETSSE